RLFPRDARIQSRVEIRRHFQGRPPVHRVPHFALHFHSAPAIGAPFQVSRKLGSARGLERSGAVAQQNVCVPVLGRANHVLSLVCQAMCAKRARSVSYARNRSDFTADSEHRKALAICEYSSSWYLCISTAAFCLAGSASMACRTSFNFASCNNSCSTLG